MLYYLCYELLYRNYAAQYSLLKVFNVFQYVTFRTAYAAVTALTLSLICAAGMAFFALQHFGIISVFFFGMFAWNNYKELRGEPQVQWMEGR